MILTQWVKIVLEEKVMITTENIREKPTEAVKLSGISQTQLANSLQIQPTQICSYMNGRKMPALDTFANLCKVLDLDANEILCIDK